MSTVILICTGIILAVVLAQIVAALGNIRETLDIIHRDLVMLFEINRKNTPHKQREYWRDQNGFRHWRKKDA